MREVTSGMTVGRRCRNYISARQVREYVQRPRLSDSGVHVLSACAADEMNEMRQGTGSNGRVLQRFVHENKLRKRFERRVAQLLRGVAR